MQRLKFAFELLVNIALPWLAYKLAQPRWGEFGGLLASSVPPLLWSLIELARHRRMDALSLMVLAGIGLSLLALALGGDPRVLLLRESLISGLIGLAFLVSLLFPKPLIYYLARATVMREDDPEGVANFEAWWQEPQARGYVSTMTLVWGAGLTGEAALRSWLAWHWSAERYLAVTPFISYSMIGALALWTLWYRRRLGGARE